MTCSLVLSAGVRDARVYGQPSRPRKLLTALLTLFLLRRKKAETA
ncbi:MAG: hypothetical protein ACLVES_01975 [Faecalibacterium prausnitzii]